MGLWNSTSELNRRTSSPCLKARPPTLELWWETQSIHVLGKGRKPREVYFGFKAALWLKRWMDSRTDEDPAVFVTIRRPYRRMTPHTMYSEIIRVVKRSGLTGHITPHSLRHTFATTLLENGADITVIQSILGHSKLITTQRYSKLSGKRRRLEYDRYFMQ